MLKESFEVHNELNPKLFQDEKLKPEIREKILEVVDTFVDNLWIKPDILDVQLLGSNASYNYTNYSDLDIHIITNFELLDASPEIVNALYNLEKTNFNKNYDVTIKGIPVELYVEDVQSGAVSNGVYSVQEDEWVKFPKRIDNLPQFDLERQTLIWKNKINSALDSKDIDEIKDLINRLYMIRKNSIAIDGEYGKGNAFFKEIRNLGLLDAMKEKVKEIKSDELSLESLTLSEMLSKDF